jgi:ectoine hydroxylase
MRHLPFTADDVARFQADGYVIVPSLLDAEEISLLRNIAKADHALTQDAASRADGEGGAVKLVVRNELPDDTIYGAIVRSARVVHTMEQLLGDEVYHYHHKMILKEARIGGAWAWHQDYGYWYNNGCLWPDLGSCMIAVDAATKANGCLQVVRGSHRLGRIDHGKVGDQTGADAERVAEVTKRLDTVYVEMEPGSAVFFHGNTLHRSDQNKSDHPRWAFIACYNTRHNDPYKESKHPRYSPLDVWDDARVKAIGTAHWQRMSANR